MLDSTRLVILQLLSSQPHSTAASLVEDGIASGIVPWFSTTPRTSKHDFMK